MKYIFLRNICFVVSNDIYPKRKEIKYINKKYIQRTPVIADFQERPSSVRNNRSSH